MATTKAATLTFSIDPSVKEALRTTAQQEHRSIANMVEVLIRDYCGRNGIELEEVRQVPDPQCQDKCLLPGSTVFFNSKENIDAQIEQVMVEIDHIQQHMTPVLHDCLHTLLKQNADPEEWEYSLPKDQIDTALIHAHYFSRKDIDTCLTFDSHEGAAPFSELFDAFQEAYRTEAEY
ncbi:hypothetical protein [Halochromatium roseum]|uniref:hypothetical protein n=1 Tax=Halochromatium roseum TaxID=391920 RepID=UPI0019142DFB|nr:hypothetical protein [Halochromatium roseum]MBK5938825.1 hypothetical protein [Halochromatium roseum]